jgi:hypothetical protein
MEDANSKKMIELLKTLNVPRNKQTMAIANDYIEANGGMDRFQEALETRKRPPPPPPPPRPPPPPPPKIPESPKSTPIKSPPQVDPKLELMESIRNQKMVLKKVPVIQLPSFSHLNPVDAKLSNCGVVENHVPTILDQLKQEMDKRYNFLSKYLCRIFILFILLSINARIPG